MDKCILKVLSSCHYWNPILQVKLLGCGQEERFPGKKWPGYWKADLTFTLFKEKVLLTLWVTAEFAFPMSQGPPHPLGGNSLLRFLKMISFHTKQDRSARCHVSFYFFSSLELNKNHILWKFTRKYKYRLFCDLLAQNSAPHWATTVILRDLHQDRPLDGK